MAVWSSTTGKRIIFIALLLAVAPSAWPQDASGIQATTAAIAAGAGSSERRAAITSRLNAAGIQYHLQDFEDRRMRKGTKWRVCSLCPAGDPLNCRGF
jgi:hypothetical protein